MFEKSRYDKVYKYMRMYLYSALRIGDLRMWVLGMRDLRRRFFLGTEWFDPAHHLVTEWFDPAHNFVT